MTVEEFLNNFDVLVDAPDGLKKLREICLSMAVRGKLVRQSQEEEPASKLFERIRAGSGLELASKQQSKLGATKAEGTHAGFFEIPPTWQWARFTDVAVIESCLVDPSDFQDLPHVAPDSIEKGTGRLLSYRTIREDAVTSPKHRFRAGQILYSKIRPNLAKAVVVDFDGLCSADMYPISSKIEARYLLLYMLSNVFLSQVTQGDNRLAMPKINRQQLSATVLPVPPVAEQKRIAAKVDQLLAFCDELEARQAEKRGTGTRLTQSALDALTSAQGPEEFAKAWQRVDKHFEMLVDGHERVGMLRKTILNLAIQGRLSKQDAAGESAAVLIKRVCDEREQFIRKGQMRRTDPVPQVGEDEQVFQIPDSWVWCRMEDVCIDSFYGPRFNKNEYSPDGVPTIRTTDMTEDGEIVLQTPPRVRVPSEKLRLYRLLRGDLIITRTGSIGTTAVFKGGYDAIPSAYLIRFRFSRLVEVDYIQIFLKSPFGQGLLQEEATRMAQPNISATAIRRMPLPLPPSAEQRQIVSVVQRFMALCDTLESKLRDEEQGAQRLAEAMAAEMVA